MEQRRIEGKSHWYHETQSSKHPQDILPLVPEAAHVDDCFLLDLAIPDDALLPFQSWLIPARKLAQVLFPVHVNLNQMHTFSAYERMSTAPYRRSGVWRPAIVQSLCRAVNTASWS